MRSTILGVVCTASISLVACSAANTESTTADAAHTAPRRVASDRVTQHSAVELVLTDLNAVDDPRATRRVVLRRLMAEYVARALINRRVDQKLGAIKKSRADGWKPPRLDSITVGSWEATDATGPDGRVTFVAFETNTTPQYGTDQLPLERFKVKMRWEDHRWKLIDYRDDWMTPAGPMGASGRETIKQLPEDVVFRNRSTR